MFGKLMVFGGLIGVALSLVAWAADEIPVRSRKTGAPGESVHYFSKSGKKSVKPKTKAPVRNYYDELFQDEPEPEKIVKTRHEVENSNYEEAEGDAGVSQAAHSKSSEESESKHVRQVRSTVPRVPNRTKTRELPVLDEVKVPSTKEVKEIVAAELQGPQTPSVTLKWVTNGDINVGQECKCSLVVKNSGSTEARDVVVDAKFPASVRLINADPFPEDNKETLRFNIGVLSPGEEKTISVNMVPTKRGEVAATADVRFTGSAATMLNVSEPMLKLAIKGPSEVLIGETLSHLVTITNPGTGVAHDVSIEAVLPAGLEHSSGKKLVMGVGAINPGESRSIRLQLAAASGGEKLLAIEAKSQTANLSQSVETKINVIAPSLDLKVEGPGLRYIDRHAKYTIVVTNSGAGATNNVKVTENLPAGFGYVKSSKGGQLDQSKKLISWFVGRLEPGQSSTLEFEVTAKDVGQYKHSVRVQADNGVEAVAVAETRVEGTSSLTMEVVDLDDPVEVGVETAYEIRIKNDGSKAASNIGISCELPPDVEIVSCDGPTGHIEEKGLLVFKTLKDLKPGDTAKFLVKVKGMASGSMKLRTRLTSDSIEKPLIVEEATKFYADNE